jgi:sirohydrochlorin ferrochelatase
LAEAIGRRGSGEVFVVPTALDFNLLQREALGHAIGEARRKHPAIALHHDDADPAHPLVVQALADQVARAAGPAGPQRTGLILAASGHGDAVSRANSYRLMRLIWEQLGLAAGEVGFIRHAQPFLLAALQKCAGRPLNWIILPQTQWRTEHVGYAEVILQNFQRDRPEAAQWRLAEPPGDHPAMIAWLTQRITRLWNEKRSRDAVRIASPKHAAAVPPESWNVGSGVIASVPDRNAMACLLERILPAGKPDRILVKVTWHGYATGTYTDSAALDLLLSALPAKAIVLEGHTSSRNVEEAGFNWETEARQNRAWIRQQDAEFLRRTGLAEVLAKHHAEYCNITEAWWDEDCPKPETFIPQALLEHRGCPLISFAKFKGPTRLAISNLFGLLPEPLRAAWHGPNLTYLARVCCDLAKLYGAVFPLCGMNEALYSAVRWNRQGLYRSRWGNYDLISDAGYLAAARDLATADILASRLQGQDVYRSAFFDVVGAELGWDEAAASDPLPQSILHLFA